MSPRVLLEDAGNLCQSHHTTCGWVLISYSSEETRQRFKPAARFDDQSFPVTGSKLQISQLVQW